MIEDKQGVCFEETRGLVEIYFVNRGGWRGDIAHLSEAITVSGLINSSLNPSGKSLPCCSRL
jgi:hypothetical protein